MQTINNFTNTIGINKSIVINYDDVSRMIDFCNDENKATSKDFYDWYLKEKPDLFTKTGLLIVDNILGKEQRSVITFDLTDPDKAIFTTFVYDDQSVICNWIFKRMDNLTLESPTYEIKYLSLNNLKKNDILCPPDIKDLIKEAVNLEHTFYNRPGFRRESAKGMLQHSLNKALKDVNKINCKAFIYTVYALLYYVSKQEPEEITTAFNKEIETQLGKFKTIYRYTGYVDLRQCKTYKPIIKKEPGEPVREYQRHIQKWIVRGHYRKSKTGLIWIDEHTKGKGEIENRVYSTEDEKALDLTPKIFEVERNIKNESDIKEVIKQNEVYQPAPPPQPQPQPQPIPTPPQIIKQNKPGIIKKIIALFLKWFKV